MCGFAGFITPGHQLDPDPLVALEAMVASLEHRGPDDVGSWTDREADLFLGFRRLSILDLSEAGHQPMISPSGRYVLTFNGEIYNHQELRAELSRDFRFRGRSDTEVLLAAVDRWGIERAVSRFRGMFAFALWDRRDRRLTLGRDRVGIKPLYVFTHARGVAWASECRAFHCFPLFEGRGSIEAAYHFLQRLSVPTPLSIFRGVEKLPPGTLTSFEVRDGRLRTPSRHRYWDLRSVAARKVSETVDERAVVERLLELIRESIALRMVADVPVGALLSGGVDSTAVVAVMQELAAEPARTFTVHFDDPDFDEGPVASEVSEYLGTRHTSVRLPTSDVMGLIPNLPRMSDEPMANPSLLPSLLVSRVARQDVVVALSGDGGDELLGGYNRYRHGGPAIRRLRRVPGFARKPLGSLLRSGATTALVHQVLRLTPRPTFGAQHSARERLEKVARLVEASGEQAAYESLLQVGMHDPPVTSVPADPGTTSADFWSWNVPLESKMMLSDQLHYLPDDLLAKLDRASMWESLEVRVPLLDHRIAEFSWSIPLSVKIRNGVSKWPLRQIAARYVPSTVLDRPKMGFTVPMARWLSQGLREWAGDTLLARNLGSSGLWRAAALQECWSKFEAGRHELALPVYAAAVLQSWSDHWKVEYE